MKTRAFQKNTNEGRRSALPYFFYFLPSFMLA